MTRILVAEDEMHILMLIQRKLESTGYEVHTTSDGAEALRLALDGKFDLLLLDIMMPNKSGLEICREVKTALGQEAPPVIIMSARGQHIDVAAGQAAGADSYIIKPFSLRQLVEHLEEVLY